MVLPVILAVLAVAAAVFLILKFTTGGKKQETGTFTESVTEGEREPESTAPAESIPESGQMCIRDRVQCAHAAVKSDKSPYYKKKYESLVKRRGKKRISRAMSSYVSVRCSL